MSNAILNSTSNCYDCKTCKQSGKGRQERNMGARTKRLLSIAFSKDIRSAEDNDKREKVEEK